MRFCSIHTIVQKSLIGSEIAKDLRLPLKLMDLFENQDKDCVDHIDGLAL